MTNAAIAAANNDGCIDVPLRIASAGGRPGPFSVRRRGDLARPPGCASWCNSSCCLSTPGLRSNRSVSWLRSRRWPRGEDRPSCSGRPLGCGSDAPVAPRGAAAALDVSTSVNFCSSSAPSAGIYLPPFQQDRPFTDGRRRPLRAAPATSLPEQVNPVNVQRMYAESQVKRLQSQQSISSLV